MQILVLGMHRSGTSLVTRLINLMGAYIGPAGLFMHPSGDNETGFWERRDMVRVNQELYKNQEANWYVVHRWQAAPRHMPPDIETILRQTLADLNAHKPWVAKDPRLCLTLPSWLPHLKQPVAVICSRHPLEIARSLQLRNQLPAEYALALWEFYTLHMLRNTQNLAKLFTQFDALLADPMGQTQRLCNQLAEYIPALLLPNRADVEAFVLPSRQRARLQDSSLQLTVHQQLLYAMALGQTPWDDSLQLSPDTARLLESMGPQLYRQQLPG